MDFLTSAHPPRLLTRLTCHKASEFVFTNCNTIASHLLNAVDRPVLTVTQEDGSSMKMAQARSILRYVGKFLQHEGEPLCVGSGPERAMEKLRAPRQKKDSSTNL